MDALGVAVPPSRFNSPLLARGRAFDALDAHAPARGASEPRRHDRMKRPHLPHIRPFLRKAFSREAWPFWGVAALLVLVASFWALWFPAHVSQVVSALVAPLAVLLSAALVSLPFRGATWLWRGWSVFRNIRSGRNASDVCHIHIHVHVSERDWLAEDTATDAIYDQSATG